MYKGQFKNEKYHGLIEKMEDHQKIHIMGKGVISIYRDFITDPTSSEIDRVFSGGTKLTDIRTSRRFSLYVKKDGLEIENELLLLGVKLKRSETYLIGLRKQLADHKKLY